MTATRTRSTTHTISISASDVRQIMLLITSDIQAVCRAAAQAAKTFDMDQALIDTSLLILNGLATAVTLQIYLERTVIGI